MAGEDFINNPREWGHHKSPFFKFPPEVRNMIYQEYLDGSEISLVIDPPLNVAVVPITGRHSAFDTSKSNHHFLLTCYQVYLEALVLYWTNTIVRNGCDGHFSRAYFLNRIPTIAKPYVQHLRDVNAVASLGYRLLRGEPIRRAPSLVEFFDEFPKLQSCLLKEWMPRWNSPFPFEIEETVARHPQVHLVYKRMTYVEVNEDPDPQGPFRPHPDDFPIMVRQYVFTNRTNGAKIVRWQEGKVQWLSDETCMKMLMAPVCTEPEADD